MGAGKGGVMRFLNLIPAPYRVLIVGNLLVALARAAALAWQVKAWHYSEQLAEQTRLHTDTLHQFALASNAQQRAEQHQRLSPEQRLSASEQFYHRALNDAQRDQSRLRDRLATADLRLPVLLDAIDSAGGGSGNANHHLTGGIGQVMLHLFAYSLLDADFPSPKRLIISEFVAGNVFDGM